MTGKLNEMVDVADKAVGTVDKATTIIMNKTLGVVCLVFMVISGILLHLYLGALKDVALEKDKTADEIRRQVELVLPAEVEKKLPEKTAEQLEPVKVKMLEAVERVDTVINNIKENR